MNQADFAPWEDKCAFSRPPRFAEYPLQVGKPESETPPELPLPCVRRQYI